MISRGTMRGLPNISERSQVFIRICRANGFRDGCLGIRYSPEWGKMYICEMEDFSCLVDIIKMPLPSCFGKSMVSFEYAIRRCEMDFRYNVYNGRKWSSYGYQGFGKVVAAMDEWLLNGSTQAVRRYGRRRL